MSKEILKSFNLNKTQNEILTLIMQGMSNEEIAHALFTTTRGVKYHIETIYRLTGHPTRPRLMAALYQRGWYINNNMVSYQALQSLLERA